MFRTIEYETGNNNTRAINLSLSELNLNLQIQVEDLRSNSVKSVQADDHQRLTRPVSRWRKPDFG